MGRYVSNRNSDGLTDENGHFRLPLKMIDGQILEGFQIQAQSTPDMSIKVTAGEGKIPYSDYAYAVWSDEDETLPISTSSSTAPRIDRVVAYVDRGMSFTSEDINHPGALKFLVVKGSASATPTAPTDTQVQSAVGAGNPFIDIGLVNVAMNTTSITSNDIDTTTRVPMSLSSNVKTPEISTTDGSSIKFAVIQQGQPLPAAIEGSTLVVLVVKE